jgi:hypothetical protein
LVEIGEAPCIESELDENAEEMGLFLVLLLVVPLAIVIALILFSRAEFRCCVNGINSLDNYLTSLALSSYSSYRKEIPTRSFPQPSRAANG